MKRKRWTKMLAVWLTVVLCLCETGGYVKAADAETEEAPVLTKVEDNSADTAMKLAKMLVGEGMEVKSAKLIGEATQFGSFTGAYETVGFNDGIVLSTGMVEQGGKSIFNRSYKDKASSNITNSKALDKNGDELKGFTIDQSNYYDPAILELTVVPKTDTLSFQYAVASDEYIHYIESYWDQFVLTVNGVNYAWLPQIKDNNNNPVPVTIGTVNNKNNSQYYRGNIKDILDSNVMEDDEHAISLNHFIYNGITKVFSVDAPVKKGEENVIRLAIADYRDAILDSAVFVKAGSVQDKQPLYGLIDIAYVDSAQKELYLRRKGGYNGAVSADVVYTDEKGNEVGRKTIEFQDGAYINIIKVSEEALQKGAVYVHLANPTGAVKVSEAKIDFDNWVSATALKAMKTKVTGNVYENKDGNKVPAANAKVAYKTVTNVVYETETDENGKYTLYNIPGGKYNIFVTNEDGTKETVADTEVTVYDMSKNGKKAEDIVLEKKVSMMVKNSDNIASLPVVIAGLGEASNGKEVKATINAVKVNESGNKEVIEKGIEKTGTTSLDYVLDINIDSDGNKQTELEKPIVVTVQIPETLKGKSDYFLYHVHNNGAEVEILYDLDNDPDTITVQIDKLSEFALLTVDSAKSGKFETAESKAVENQLSTAENNSVNQAVEIVKKLYGTVPDMGNNEQDNNKPDDNQNNSDNSNNQNNSNSSSNNASYSDSYNGNLSFNLTEPLRQKIFEGITVTSKKILYKGDNDIIEVNGVSESNIIVDYMSKDSKIVSVDKDGNIEAKKTGTTTIVTEITKEGVVKKFETEITVNKPCIKILGGKSKIKQGKTTTFKAEVYGLDAAVTWSVSNKNIATINSKTGKLKAKKAGTVTVYAKAGTLKKSYKVKVTK